MLDTPNGDGSTDGTDETPLVMMGDSAAGWELLLGLQYNSYGLPPTPKFGITLLTTLLTGQIFVPMTSALAGKSYS